MSIWQKGSPRSALSSTRSKASWSLRGMAWASCRSITPLRRDSSTPMALPPSTDWRMSSSPARPSTGKPCPGQVYSGPYRHRASRQQASASPSCTA